MFGAVAGPLAYLFPVFGVGLSGGFAVGSLKTAYDVVGDSSSSIGQKTAALSLVGLSIFGAGAAAQNVSANGFWYNGTVFSSNAVVPQFSSAQPQPTIRAIPRVADDISVNPRPPSVLGPEGRTIGSNPAQNAAVAKFVSALQRLRATDIRVHQEQVNAAGVRVGINKPDLQFTWEGVRYYLEWDTSASSRGIPHAERALANDPNGVTLTWTLE